MSVCEESSNHFWVGSGGTKKENKPLKVEHGNPDYPLQCTRHLNGNLAHLCLAVGTAHLVGERGARKGGGRRRVRQDSGPIRNEDARHPHPDAIHVDHLLPGCHDHGVFNNARKYPRGAPAQILRIELPVV